MSGVRTDRPCVAATACSTDYSEVLARDIWCRETVQKTCAANEYCSTTTNTCEVENITVNIPALVRQGEKAIITWSGVPPTYSSCRIQGPGDEWTALALPQGRQKTNPITSSGSTFIFYCTRDGVEEEIDRNTIDVIPSIYES